ncbi:MAG: hypothetical protein IPG67_05050 [Acidobacteria bacterium]|nr:hypothetical protein [Acidobacteriota bacterium]MBK7933388.1 hypothetical protein [Acidobacteriota bacterium]
MGDNWELPKPVFRSTSGSLPQDFPARAGADAQPQAAARVPDEGDQILSSLYAPPSETVEEPAAPEPPPTAPAIVEIEPQPFISEQFSTEEIVTLAPDKPVKKGGAGKTFLVVAAMILIGVVTGILALVYLLFIRTPSESTF